VTTGSDLDESILRHLTPRWQKVAMVVAKVLMDADPDLSQLGDFEVAERIKLLVQAGRIEARGDLKQMRRSEIRSSVAAL